MFLSFPQRANRAVSVVAPEFASGIACAAHCWNPWEAESTFAPSTHRKPSFAARRIINLNCSSFSNRTPNSASAPEVGTAAGKFLDCGIHHPHSLFSSSAECKEYLREATPTVYLSSLKPNAEVIQKRGKACSTDNKLIVGGEAAKLGEFPHMAALGYRTAPGEPLEFKCGGTLISDRFILTATHCLTQELQIVRLGDLNLVSDADGADPKDFAIEELISHPKYSAKSKHNDIALVKLAGSVRFSTKIRPACLYQSPEVNQQKLTATGYGAVESCKLEVMIFELR